MSRGERLVDVDAEARRVPRMHGAAVEGVRVWKHRVGLLRVAHVFLDPEIVDAEIEMQRGRHRDRAEIGGAMRSRPHVVQLGERRDFPQVADPPAVHDGHADVVDQLFLDELLAVVDGVEHFAHRDRRRRVLANRAERRLILRRHWILEPEQPVRLETLAEPRGLDRRKAVMHVVQ